mmetsp:Transcript_104412/g.185670  ORF Transcript_104412/g.185670 Transcript_104412/m.185670 type:complete len:536 (+) Transcript_104412:69-1676(+)
MAGYGKSGMVSAAVAEQARQSLQAQKKQRQSLRQDIAKRASARAEQEEEALEKALAGEDADDISYELGVVELRKRSTSVPPLLRPCYSSNARRLRRLLKPFVNSRFFSCFSVLLVLASCAFMGIEVELQPLGPDSTTAREPWLDVLAWMINIGFAAEWGLRSLVGGAYWLKDLENVLFTIAVWVPFAMYQWSRQAAQVRVVLRLLQLGKVVHTIKNVPGLKVVWLLIAGLFSSGGTLLWSCLLLAVSLIFFSIIAVDYIGYAPEWQYASPDSWARKFTNLGDALRVMSRFMNSDGAMSIVEELMTKQPLIWIFLFAFQVISQYVIFNLITAVICEQAVKIVQEDEANLANEALAEKERLIKELGELFMLLDADGNGEVDAQEFEAAFEIPALSNKLLQLDVKQAELKKLYHALDTDGTGSMSVDEFCEGIPELFGQASAYGMLKAKKKAERAEKSLKRILRKYQNESESKSGKGKKKKDKKKDDEGPSQGELRICAEIKNLETEVETRLSGLDEMIKKAAKSVDRIAAVLAPSAD